MTQKVCPMCSIDEFYNWFMDCEWRGIEDECIGMIDEGLSMVLLAIEDGIPSSYLCEKHRKDRAQQMGLFDKEVVQGESAH